MNTLALTHEAISMALSENAPLSNAQRAALLGLVARDKRQQQERDTVVEHQAAELQRLRLALSPPDVDALAQHIRCVNGGGSMGAGALAESIVDWLAVRPPPQPSRWTLPRKG